MSKFYIFYNDDDKQHNEYAILENDVLSKLSDIYQIFWQVDAGHGLWFNELYKTKKFIKDILILH